MRVLDDYVCPACGHEAERLVDHAVGARCSECDTEMDRRTTAPRIALDPISGDFPSATRTWERQHEEKQRKANRPEVTVI